MVQLILGDSTMDPIMAQYNLSNNTRAKTLSDEKEPILIDIHSMARDIWPSWQGTRYVAKFHRNLKEAGLVKTCHFYEETSYQSWVKLSERDQLLCEHCHPDPKAQQQLEQYLQNHSTYSIMRTVRLKQIRELKDQIFTLEGKLTQRRKTLESFQSFIRKH